MKKLFKLFPTLFVVILGVSMASCSDDKDEIVDYNELPSASQTFVKTYFGNVNVVTVTYDKDKNNQEYDVVLANGFELTFNVNGEWVDVDAPMGQTIPDGIAPEPIAKYVTTYYPDNGINEISKEKTGYDVELVNGVDLMFNLEGGFIGMD